MKNLRIVLLLLISLSASPALAERCLEDWACWEAQEVTGGFEFFIHNRKPHTFTATLVVRARNLQHEGDQSGRYTVTRVMAGGERERVLTLSKIDALKRAKYREVFYWVPGDMDAEHESDEAYRLPYAPGSSFPIVQGFGGGYSHRGASRYAVDIAMPVGTPIHAAREGQVVQVTEHHNRGGASRRYARYANFIIILHPDGTTGEYHHLQQQGAVVQVDDEVETGQLIGYSGNTGFSSLPHLHFAVYRPRSHGDFESLPFRWHPDD